MNSIEKNIWSEGYKIPWNDPEFSRRMLAEHLNQSHDMASRSFEWIKRQCLWIHENVLGSRHSNILDLGCGPGFYSQHMCDIGHTCHGIDFSPASIEYAVKENRHPELCSFLIDDIRYAPYGSGYDMAMFIFGEFNVFSGTETNSIMKKLYESVKPGGVLITEVQNFEAVRSCGMMENSCTKLEQGLFSDSPHTLSQENFWLDEKSLSLQLFRIKDEKSGKETVYRSTTRALQNREIEKIFTEAGFVGPEKQATWPSNTESLTLWTARKPE